MTKEETKDKIINLISDAEEMIPAVMEADLPPIDNFPQVPQWHPYENKIWEIGENIRQLLATHTTLRKDDELLIKILAISLNGKAKRGRQSFIMLLGYKHCEKYASRLITQIHDHGVNGHVISTVYKMGVIGYAHLINPFTNDPMNWIRKAAAKYIDK